MLPPALASQIRFANMRAVRVSIQRQNQRSRLDRSLIRQARARESAMKIRNGRVRYVEHECLRY
jgi:hypothetical protein